MKTTIFSFFILFLLLLSNSSNAQYGNNNGLDRRIMSGQGQNPHPKKQKPIDQVQASIDILTKELNLDGFQSAILKNIIEDYQTASISITSQEIPQEAKYEKLKIANKKMESQILEILNEEQKTKFEELKNKTEKKKKKKKKKGKKDEEKVEETPE
ncbi:hypothetical protein [Flavobacterium soli]|uniref:hypothetical protein n=1 Tax=Flavobacterium soli TaxID=344881 RepID=UPI0003F6BF96|nr:hypothetical protein [Flavobacterium soli]